MADDLKPMTDADTEIPAADAPAATAAPLKPAGAGDDLTDEPNGDAKDRVVEAKAAVRQGAGKLGQQAADRLRLAADDGKARAGGALDQLSQLLTDAAGQVDDRLGEQYGRYARDAAGQVRGLADTIRDKNVDELLDDARGFVRASPAVAIGVAAALGFAAARLFQAGLDDARA